VSLAQPLAGGDASAVPVTALYLSWTGVAATLLAWKLARNRRWIEQLAAHRGQLVAQAITAEEHARKQLAYELHDEPAQTLAAARLILSDYPGHDDPRLQKVDRALQTTLEKLRELIFDLRPLAIDHEGITPALQEIAEHHSIRYGAAISIRINPSALGSHDEVVFSLGRELLTNAARHAHASAIELTLTKQPATLTLTVTDDGTGISAGRERQALRDGHIGLASARERVQALGGSLNLATTPGRGTTLTATLPTRRANDRHTHPTINDTPHAEDRRMLGTQTVA
jgi:two-component system NarL family sensor kinase